YDSGIPIDQRDLVALVTSNRLVDRRSLELTMSLPFRLLADRPAVSTGGPIRDRPRTLNRLLRTLTDWFTANPMPDFAKLSVVHSQDTNITAADKKRDFAA